jgi:hypothetical protein
MIHDFDKCAFKYCCTLISVENASELNRIHVYMHSEIDIY